MYLTYEDYQTMGGTLDETTFNDFEYEAECIVNWYTFNRLKNETEYPEELGRCMYKIIQYAKMQADSMILGTQVTTTTDSEGHVVTVETSPFISSQSNDGVSTGYNTVNASELFDKISSTGKGNPFEVTIQRYLQGVMNSLGQKLLYRGLYPNE